MITNDAGVHIIKDFEGFRPDVYLDPVGIPTIGYGSIWDFHRERVTMGHPPISIIEGNFLLGRELRHAERCVARLIKIPITQNEFSALVSFTFNLGSGNLQASTLRRKLNRGDRRVGVANEFLRWRWAGGRILPGLVRRRKEEAVLFLS